MSETVFTRRAALAAAGGLFVAGCDKISQNSTVQKVLSGAEALNLDGQRLVLTSSQPLAREYPASEISKNFKANGTVRPDSDEYRRMALTEFTDWRLKVDGLVAKPASYSLDELKAMPSRTQITRHDCVEGWSAIGQW